MNEMYVWFGVACVAALAVLLSSLYVEMNQPLIAHPVGTDVVGLCRAVGGKQIKTP